MGCDIHMFCEELKTIKGEKRWFNKDHWEINHYFDPNDEDEFDGPYNVVEICGDRNYSTFSALCGVRGRTGETPKISEPRGLPDDCDPMVKQNSDRWDCDGHSHSYVTLADVKDFVERGDPVKFSGMVSEQAAKRLDEGGSTPDEWCGWTSQEGWVFREWEDTEYNPLRKLYEKMAERFNKYRKPDDIEESTLCNFRIVFWFDN